MCWLGTPSYLAFAFQLSKCDWLPLGLDCNMELQHEVKMNIRSQIWWRCYFEIFNPWNASSRFPLMTNCFFLLAQIDQHEKKLRVLLVIHNIIKLYRKISVEVLIAARINNRVGPKWLLVISWDFFSLCWRWVDEPLYQCLPKLPKPNLCYPLRAISSKPLEVGPGRLKPTSAR